MASSLCFSVCPGALEEHFYFADSVRFSGCSGVPEGCLGFVDSLRFSDFSEVLAECLGFGEGNANPPPIMVMSSPSYSATERDYGSLSNGLVHGG